MDKMKRPLPVLTVICSVTETTTKDRGEVNDNVIMGGFAGPYNSRTTEVRNIKHYFDTLNTKIAVVGTGPSTNYHLIYDRLKAAVRCILPEYNELQWFKTKFVNSDTISSLQGADTKIDCFFYIPTAKDGKSSYENVLRTSFSFVDMGNGDSAKKEIYQTPSIYATKMIDENNKIELNISKNVDVSIMDGESAVYNLLQLNTEDNKLARDTIFSFEFIDFDKLMMTKISDEIIDQLIASFNIPKDEIDSYKITLDHFDETEKPYAEPILNQLTFVNIALEIRKVIPIVFVSNYKIAEIVSDIDPFIRVFTIDPNKE